jgi:flagellar protein FliS
MTMMTNGRGGRRRRSFESASPELMLGMLFERLVLDVEKGLEAQRRADFEETRKQLTHALEIVSELQRSMRPEDFRGGYDLTALYEFLHRRLVLASIGTNAGITNDCLTLVKNLCEGWREVACDGGIERTA